ncbi:hypothetical protein [Flectobacillus major]|uniref:hypothetical protein n=1 Tax=Flectobacillus major TaxID=103 RepID=UPI0011824E99|nr:hypothetical protein [Flectobacillus major]
MLEKFKGLFHFFTIQYHQIRFTVGWMHQTTINFKDCSDWIFCPERFRTLDKTTYYALPFDWL